MQAIYQNIKKIKVAQNSTTQKQMLNLDNILSDVFTSYMCI